MSDARDSIPALRSLFLKSETFQGLLIVILRASTVLPLYRRGTWSRDTVSDSSFRRSSMAFGTSTPYRYGLKPRTRTVTDLPSLAFP